MQRPQRETVTLEDILITEELSWRNPREANLLKENQALQALARQLVNQPPKILQNLVDIALDLCSAGTAGVSLIETTPTGEEIFRWNVLAGTLEQYVGGTTPRDFSPCGVCLDRGSPQLFSHPEQYFTYFQAANIPIVEGLVLPLIAENQALGTIWIMSHDQERHFDSEDVRIMMSLADFTATALLLKQRQTGELLAANAALEAEIVERRQAEERSRALISNLPGGAAFVVDRNLRYLLAAGEALASAGFKSEDFVGRTIFEVLPPELAASYEVNYRRALAGEIFEHEHQAHDRTYISRGTPLRAENGDIYAVLVVSYDISDRKQSELSLRESEERFRLFVTASSNMIYRMSADWREMRNLEGKNILANTENPSRTWFETYILPEDQSQVWATIQEAIRTRSKFELEHRVIQQDGLIGWVFSRAIPMLNQQGEIVEWFGTGSDVTDRKRAEAKLHRAAEIDAFRVKLSDALRSLADPVQIQAEACRILGEHLSIDCAYYVEVNEAESYARVNQDYLRDDSPSLVGDYRLTDFGWTVPLLQRGETIIVANAETSDIVPAADRAAMATVRIAAHISIPLIKAGALVGALCVTESVPREWLATEIELVRETAERIWATIERARAEAALQASEIQRIQEQAALEQERRRAETLAELDRIKTLFFSNISHEFRTPLTLLLAPVQDALSDSANPLPPAQRERLNLVHHNSLRLLKLVNTLLDFSRIEAGRMEAVYEPTDLAMFTIELASVFRSAIEQAGLQLVVDCPPISEPVYVDREMWEKIVLNLLSNAFKFTFEGKITVRLYLADDAHVRLQVEDTGTGIEAEELPHLMKRFYQVRGVKARTHEGSGIGLALVQELIKLHSGTVEISSAVGQGTCFTVTIPLGTDHLPSDRIQATHTLTSTALSATSYVQEAERWLPEEDTGTPGQGDAENRGNTGTPGQGDAENRENTGTPRRGDAENREDTGTPRRGDAENREDTGTPGQGDARNYSLSASLRLNVSASPLPSPAHILIVDDNADMRDYLKRILNEHVTVEAVADGAAALAAVQERMPDLILSDVMMPRLGGFELLKILRTNPQTKEIPIILLSARAGEKSVIEGLEAGADDYLIKPFSAIELVTRINAHLQMAQLRGEALREERTISRRKDEVLSTVSHELNTPLVAILGWTRLLRSSPSNQSMLMKALETIERNATLQAKLVQDLLDISRITAGKISLNVEPVELQKVIETAIATVRQSVDSKNICLKCQFNSSSATVAGDPDRLQQIVLNLLTNAVKFTAQGGSIEVRLDVKANKNEVQIVVSDNGIGIGGDLLPDVFDTFRQSESSKSKGGLGLGLAIARHLVELHGGTIHAQSPGIGQGATFTVKLPLININL
ncbi:histidine kinase [Hapalosiphon sp. MRB220]|nr:histidine kinase [Hapalosiphon sp. MRB220]